jgi:hypothetical protein
MLFHVTATANSDNFKSFIFRYITSCSLLKVNRHLGGSYRLHLQGRINRAKYQSASRWQANKQP